MKFNRLLRSERERLDLTQAECAVVLGLPLQTFKEWELGYQEPKEVTQEGCLARLKAVAVLPDKLP